MSACSKTALLINGTIDAMASPNMASTHYGFPHSGPLGLRIPRIALRVCSKLITLGGRACPQALSKADLTKPSADGLPRGGRHFPCLPEHGCRLIGLVMKQHAQRQHV